MIHKSGTRGITDIGWLKSFHTFSFGEYYDPERLSFNALRVINDDTIKGGMGFGTHGHKDMEIISIVISGMLEHEDSLGNKGLIKPGEIQTMSAGSGVRHSEWNGSKTEAAHFLQVWIEPATKGLQPSYGQQQFNWNENRNQLIKVCGGGSYADNNENNGALKINQNAAIFIARLDGNAGLTYQPKTPHFIQIITGELEINDEKLETGDFLSSSEQRLLKINSISEETLLILFSF